MGMPGFTTSLFSCNTVLVGEHFERPDDAPHARDPSPENYGVWLDPGFEEKEALTDLLRPYPSDGMEAYPVSRRVNKPSNNEPSVVQPAA